MHEIKIELLTPLHIGSGKELMSNTEYLYFDQQQQLTVIDEEKVLKIIGEENIKEWVNIIQQNGSLKDYLLKRKPDLISEDIKKRSINVYGSNIARHKSLKEQLHDGRQISMIPGSSIKGAIRTAILGHFALKDKDLAKRSLKNNYGKYDAHILEKKLFGNNPNEDVFRFLQIGDAYFDYQTIATTVQIFNLGYNVWKFKKDGSHLVECIAQEHDSSFHVKINNELLKKNKTYKDVSFLNINNLFKIINGHTLMLLQKEKKFWREDDNIDESAFDNYLDNIDRIIEDCKKCKNNEAVMRMGFGSGWNFITGGWAKDEDVMDDREYDNFLKQMRRKKYDETVPFPKTRKMDEDGDILGFVKISF